MATVDSSTYTAMLGMDSGGLDEYKAEQFWMKFTLPSIGSGNICTNAVVKLKVESKFELGNANWSWTTKSYTSTTTSWTTASNYATMTGLTYSSELATVVIAHDAVTAEDVIEWDLTGDNSNGLKSFYNSNPSGGTITVNLRVTSGQVESSSSTTANNSLPRFYQTGGFLSVDSIDFYNSADAGKEPYITVTYGPGGGKKNSGSAISSGLFMI